MPSKKVRLQLAVFLLIAVLGVGFTGIRYVGVDRMFGSGYTVTMRMQDTGGLFANSEVTYRGVSVGRVQDIRLTETGAAARLHFDSKMSIPKSAKAVVANRSAIGEQYVDLQPANADGPYLEAGSVIKAAQVSTPPPPDELLTNVNELVTSVPRDSLETVVDELGTAFQGTGPRLQRLLDNADAVVRTADQHLPQTAGLLGNGNEVLQTQQEQAGELRDFSSGLHDIADQLNESDPDVRKVLERAPGASAEVNEFVKDSGNDLGRIVSNLTNTSELVEVRQPATEQMLVALPMISAFSHTLTENGRGHLGVVLNFDNPSVCTQGYEGTNRRSGEDTEPVPPNTEAGCTVPEGDETGVRGSQNVPRAPVPEPAEAPPPLPLV